jgi:hypothetical protein
MNTVLCAWVLAAGSRWLTHTAEDNELRLPWKRLAATFDASHRIHQAHIPLWAEAAQQSGAGVHQPFVDAPLLRIFPPTWVECLFYKRVRAPHAANNNCNCAALASFYFPICQNAGRLARCDRHYAHYTRAFLELRSSFMPFFSANSAKVFRILFLFSWPI